MFDIKTYEDRLAQWSIFRSSLAQAEDPLVAVAEYYKNVELVSQRYDPWDRDNWPNPWTLIFENKYCLFLKTLGMCYSLMLTEKYKDTDVKLMIIKDKDLQTKYIAQIEHSILGYKDDVCLIDDIVNEISVLNEYSLEKLH